MILALLVQCSSEIFFLCEVMFVRCSQVEQNFEEPKSTIMYNKKTCIVKTGVVKAQHAKRLSFVL